MSAESTNVSSETPAEQRPEPRVLLRLPDVAAPPAAQPLPAVLTRSPQTRTRGMEVLQRVLAHRSGIFAWLTGPNRWQNRLWVATCSLIAVSGLMLAIGMRQSSNKKHAAVADDPLLHEEFESELDPGNDQGEVRHVVAYHATHEEGGARAEASQTGVIQPVAYEVPKAAAPRGAWLEGTIIPDESE